MLRIWKTSYHSCGFIASIHILHGPRNFQVSSRNEKQTNKKPHKTLIELKNSMDIFNYRLGATQKRTGR